MFIFLGAARPRGGANKKALLSNPRLLAALIHQVRLFPLHYVMCKGYYFLQHMYNIVAGVVCYRSGGIWIFSMKIYTSSGVATMLWHQLTLKVNILYFTCRVI